MLHLFTVVVVDEVERWADGDVRVVLGDGPWVKWLAWISAPLYLESAAHHFAAVLCARLRMDHEGFSQAQRFGGGA
eukprot:7385729-Prymnesium_polylepis.2